MFRDSTFSISFFSLSTPRYLCRAAQQQVQSIKMCLTVREKRQIWHSGWFDARWREFQIVGPVMELERRRTTKCVESVASWLLCKVTKELELSVQVFKVQVDILFSVLFYLN